MTKQEFDEKMGNVKTAHDYLDLFDEALEQDNFSELWFGNDEREEEK